MAGDWIKMRTDLATSPKVVRMASALKADGRPDKLRVVGALHAVWCLFDAHSEDGALIGYTPDVVDDLIGWPGFCDALLAVGWAKLEGETLSLPRFGTHNGQGAKRRAMEADRKKEARKASASNADEMRTREEKRREEKEPPMPPSGGDVAAQPKADAKQKRVRTSSPKLTFAAWRDSIPAGQKPIPADHAAIAYARTAKLPDSFLALAWIEFTADSLNHIDKKQADWPAAFHNYLRHNYLKLWRTTESGYELTDKGAQAYRAWRNRVEAENAEA